MLLGYADDFVLVAASLEATLARHDQLGHGNTISG